MTQENLTPALVTTDTTPHAATVNTPLTQAQMSHLVSELARVKSKQDVEAALAIYHADCVLDTPPLGVQGKGTEVLRRQLRAWFKMAPDYEVTLEGSAFQNDTMVTWGKIHVTLTGNYDGHVPNGKRACVPVFILFRFADGRVSWESFNYDFASLCRQCGVPPEAVYPKPRTRA